MQIASLWVGVGSYSYEGEWLDGAPHGRGLLRRKSIKQASSSRGKGRDCDELEYEGCFREGAFHGAGKLRRVDGSFTYEGEFVRGE